MGEEVTCISSSAPFPSPFMKSRRSDRSGQMKIGTLHQSTTSIGFTHLMPHNIPPQNTPLQIFSTPIPSWRPLRTGSAFWMPLKARQLGLRILCTCPQLPNCFTGGLALEEKVSPDVPADAFYFHGAISLYVCVYIQHFPGLIWLSC